jgi:hypothetical protein
MFECLIFKACSKAVFTDYSSLPDLRENSNSGLELDRRFGIKIPIMSPRGRCLWRFFSCLSFLRPSRGPATNREGLRKLRQVLLVFVELARKSEMVLYGTPNEVYGKK